MSNYIAPLDFLHSVERFIGRDLSYEDGNAVIEMAEENDSGTDARSVQHVAELVMTRADFRRVYGTA